MHSSCNTVALIYTKCLWYTSTNTSILNKSIHIKSSLGTVNVNIFADTVYNQYNQCNYVHRFFIILFIYFVSYPVNTTQNLTGYIYGIYFICYFLGVYINR